MLLLPAVVPVLDTRFPVTLWRIQVAALSKMQQTLSAEIHRHCEDREKERLAIVCARVFLHPRFFLGGHQERILRIRRPLAPITSLLAQARFQSQSDGLLRCGRVYVAQDTSCRERT